MGSEIEILEVHGLHRSAGLADYTQADAMALVGRMVKSEHEAGVYGRITKVQGFRDVAEKSQPYFGVVVEWAQKPKAELYAISTLFRRDVDKYYPLVYGGELQQAEQVWRVHQETQAMKQHAATIQHDRGRGR